jgi:ATP-dependent DNA helicase RecG
MVLEDAKNVHIKDIKIPNLTPQKKKILYKLKLYTLFDVFTFFPIRYEDRTKIRKFSEIIKELYTSQSGKVNGTVVVEVLEHKFVPIKNRKLLKVLVTDGEMKAELVCYNREFLVNTLKIGERFIITGTWEYRFNTLQCATFDYSSFDNDSYKKDEFGVVLPIYSSTESVRQRTIRKIVHLIVSHFYKEIEDEIPEYVRNVRHLLPLSKIIKFLHIPPSLKSVEIARKNMVYYEFFKTNVIIEYQRTEDSKVDKGKRYSSSNLADEFVSSLPFELTSAQRRAIEEIKIDLFSNKVMHRLIQGDVGSGKTVVAIYAMLVAIENGFQAAIMVPTEVLAVQHYINITNLLGGFAKKHKINIRLLKGGMSQKTRKLLSLEMEIGKSHIIVGTHAIFQEGIKFRNLGLVVIDEQHRFGVEQRARLISKGDNPDVLVMTATPIPRTLTMTVYGTLDLTVIDELPLGRKKIITKWYKKNDAQIVYEKVKEELRKDFKSYFVYPFIEDSETLEDIQSLIDAYNFLSSEVFRDYKVGMLHGKMTPEEKYDIMQSFKKGEIKILASTTVIEVGIDVPDATVIVIEGAERFGLSQLHQLRGRVGRGPYQSYCYLITSERISEDAKKRMLAMTRYEDGFSISEIDLSLRGPGEIIGYQQSGLPEFLIADLIKDQKVLELTRNDVKKIFKSDPNLDDNKNRLLKEIINRHLDKLSVVKSG